MSPTKPAIGAPIAVARSAATKSLCVLMEKEPRLLLDERRANTGSAGRRLGDVVDCSPPTGPVFTPWRREPPVMRCQALLAVVEAQVPGPCGVLASKPPPQRRPLRLMSTMPLTAARRRRWREFCVVPIAAVSSCSNLQLYSITSSARASSVGGSSNPRALAVFRLMISSSRVGCWTGRLLAFSPFSIRST
jgi:hypothetical protein